METVYDYVNAYIGFIVDYYVFLWESIKKIWDYIGPYAMKVLTKSFNNIKDIFARLFNAIQTLFSAFSDLFQGNWGGFAKKISNVFIDAIAAMLKGWDYGLGRLLAVVDMGLRALGFESNLEEGFTGVIDNMIESLDKLKFTFDKTKSEGRDFLGMIGDFTGGFFSGGGGGPSMGAASGPRGKNMEYMTPQLGVESKGERGLVTGAAPVLALADGMKKMNNEFSMTLDLSAQIEGAFVGLGMAIGGLISGTMTFGEIFAQSIAGLASLLIDLGQQFIAAGVAASTFYASLMSNPPLAIAAGVALVAAGAAIKGLQSRTESSPPALAKGGLAFGETLALVGDNPNAGSDPEVIAPLSKLQGMMGGGQEVIVTGRISGNDIRLSNQRSQRNANRFLR